MTTITIPGPDLSPKAKAVLGHLAEAGLLAGGTVVLTNLANLPDHPDLAWATTVAILAVRGIAKALLVAVTA